jgi:hypothetical protein
MIPSRVHLLRSAVAIGVIAASLASCGRVAEKAAEEAVEKAIESDTSENVEIDFTDDGLTVEGDDGDVTINADGDGVVIEASDANGEGGTLDIDEDGTFTVTDESGEVATGEMDADGETVEFAVEGEDGDAAFSSSVGIPEQWPSDVPQPEGLDDVNGTYFSDGDNVSVFVTGTTASDPSDYYDSYVARLVAAGFEEQSTFSDETLATGNYARGDMTITVSAQGVDGAATNVTIGIG